jgi:predicted transcriptional regulator
MRKNRDQLSIVAALLEAAETGTNKTRIMYAANLSFKLLEKYLKLTRNSGLLDLNNSTYELTPEGRVFVSRHRGFCAKNKKY